MFNVIASAMPLLAQMGRHMDFDNGGWGWLLMSLMMAAGVIVVVVVIVLLVRGTSGGVHLGQRPGQDSPLDIAKRRYAAGEISAEEFERIRKDLG